MNEYLNIKNGKVSFDNEKQTDAIISTVDAIRDAYIDNDKSLVLTVNFEKWISSQLVNIASTYVFSSKKDAEDSIFGDLDFLGEIFDILNEEIANYPHFRDYQHDFIMNDIVD